MEAKEGREKEGKEEGIGPSSGTPRSMGMRKGRVVINAMDVKAMGKRGYQRGIIMHAINILPAIPTAIPFRDWVNSTSEEGKEERIEEKGSN